MKFASIIFTLFISLQAFAQKEKIQKHILANPIENKAEFDSLFQITEIDRFARSEAEKSVILENGYAKWQIKNRNHWKANVANRQVRQIDIVFTKYPKHKKDWITNYYELLANRLLELFSIDSALNDKQIKWNLVLQTACQTASKAKNMFHGIVVFYDLTEIEKEAEPKRKISSSQIYKKPLEDTISNAEFLRQYEIEFKKQIEEDENFRKSKLKKKNKERKIESKCPDFKQRRRIFRWRKK